MVSAYIANGEIDTEFVPVESEHSAMSAAIGSEAAGARTLTATSSAGLALMWRNYCLQHQKPYAYRISSVKPHIIRTDQHQL